MSVEHHPRAAPRLACNGDTALRAICAAASIRTLPRQAGAGLMLTLSVLRGWRWWAPS